MNFILNFISHFYQSLDKAKFDCQHLGIFFSFNLGGKIVFMTNCYQSFSIIKPKLNWHIRDSLLILSRHWHMPNTNFKAFWTPFGISFLNESQVFHRWISYFGHIIRYLHTTRFQFTFKFFSIHFKFCVFNRDPALES